jgi:hypothetical protein
MAHCGGSMGAGARRARPASSGILAAAVRTLRRSLQNVISIAGICPRHAIEHDIERDFGAVRIASLARLDQSFRLADRGAFNGNQSDIRPAEEFVSVKAVQQGPFICVLIETEKERLSVRTHLEI